MQSKTKVAITLAVALIIISLSYTVQEKTKPPAKTTQEEVRELVQAALKKSIQNPDAAVLQAWEDSIYKNHPEMDQLLNGTSSDDVIIEDKTKPTATDLFSRDLFAKYMEAKQQGREIDAEVQKEIVDAILGETYVIEEIEYDGTGLSIIKKPTTQDLKTYGNKMGVIAKTPYPANMVHEVNIFQNITQGGLSELDEASLVAIKGRYESMRNSFIETPVPQNLTTFHIKMIQGIDGIIKSLQGVFEINTDPIGSMAKITRYQDALNTMTAAVMGIKSTFVENNISFSTNEPGYLFME